MNIPNGASVHPSLLQVVSVVGARPQFIKAAPVSRALRQVAHETLVHTGQHYDQEMSAIFFDELHIPEPDYNLGIGSGSHGWQTGQMLIQIEEVLLKEKPDWVLVYGDTNSTLAGTLAAVKLHIPVAHVEAGLRSFNRSMPEEHNRVLTDHAADLLFCPTQTAVDNLTHEGVTCGVRLVGDVMYDAILYNITLAEQRSDVLARLNLTPGDYALVTVHRPRNTDDPARLRAILSALEEIGQEMPVVFPVHPRTRQATAKLESDSQFPNPPIPNLQFIDPVGYLDMLALEKHARLILTDSGGVQKEAYLFGVPCLTLREETEWVETVEAGWNLLLGAGRTAIVRAAREFRPVGSPPPLFGDGHASERIVALLVGQGHPCPECR
ncbi:MAG: UDP-N-acetylglucosamine 2-epimerase (non-hydrolyzing) [Chloroflexota bacterium]|nr:UDP-N-acetylglucosamine 2-epimerase (non-hydrolyzing) [Chloroflexota bacterium]